MQASHTLDRLNVIFDHDHAVADAGLLLTATVAQHLGLCDLIDATVSLPAGKAGYYRPGRKTMTLVQSMIAGGDFIDDADVLRCASTAAVLDHPVMAPSTLGTFLRCFEPAHLDQLDTVTGHALRRAWTAGAAPTPDTLTVDIDSSICEVYGHDKIGAAYGYTGRLGYHPLLAARADTGEVLHSRFRSGNANTMLGAEAFIRETIDRARTAGAAGGIVMRADSGFWAATVLDTLRRLDVRFSVTVRLTSRVHEAIADIPPVGWVPIGDYPDSGVCELGETTLGDDRLIVRRVCLLDDNQPSLFATWRYHAFVTDRAGQTRNIDADHRAHAVIELVIRDLKAGGWAHHPSGNFHANAAWSAIAVLAHNLTRWTALLSGYLPQPGPLVAKTFRRRMLALPGRVTSGARQHTLRLPTRLKRPGFSGGRVLPAGFPVGGSLAGCSRFRARPASCSRGPGGVGRC